MADDWLKSDNGIDTYLILNKVKLTRTSYAESKWCCTYFLTEYERFPTFLFKINKRGNDKCNCGERGNVIHFIFGNCPLMKHNFRFDIESTLRWNLKKVLFSLLNCFKIRDNSNILNDAFVHKVYILVSTLFQVISIT